MCQGPQQCRHHLHPPHCLTSAPSPGSSTATLLTSSKGHHNKLIIILHLGYRVLTLGKHVKSIKCKKMPSGAHFYMGIPSPEAFIRVDYYEDGTTVQPLLSSCVPRMEDGLLKRLSLPNWEDTYKCHTVGMKMPNGNSKGTLKCHFEKKWESIGQNQEQVRPWKLSGTLIMSSC